MIASRRLSDPPGAGFPAGFGSSSEKPQISLKSWPGDGAMLEQAQGRLRPGFELEGER